MAKPDHQRRTRQDPTSHNIFRIGAKVSKSKRKKGRQKDKEGHASLNWKLLSILGAATLATFTAIITPLGQKIVDHLWQDRQATISRVACASMMNISIINHESGLYIDSYSRPQAGANENTIDVTKAIAQPSVARKGCPIHIRPHFADSRKFCLDISSANASTSDVIWTPCKNEPSQVWIREEHWRTGGLIWERLHSALNYNLCLQQAAKGGVGTPLIAQPCGPDWLQQWRLIDS